MNDKGQIVWDKVTDLTKDEQAWLLAKVAALPGEEVRDTIKRAQSIKETL